MIVYSSTNPNQVVLDKFVKSAWIVVPPGRAAGIKQNAFGLVNAKKVIEHNFVAYIGAEEEYDRVEISGSPEISFKSSPCVNGDEETVDMMINMIPRVLQALPGLLRPRYTCIC